LSLLVALQAGCSATSASGHGAPAQKAETGVARQLWIDGPAGKLSVEDGGGGGLPVVLLPGLAGDRSVWTAQLAHLRKTRRAVAIEPRGFGASEKASDGDYAMDALAADVAAAVDALGLSRFVLVGHSMGAAVMSAYAGAHRDRVAGLFFVDPTGDMTQTPEEEKARLHRELWAKTYPSFREPWYDEMLGPSGAEVREKVLTALRRAPQEVVAKTVDGVFAYNPIPALEKYHGPMFTLYLSNNDDPFALQHLVPEMPSRLVTGTGHWLMMDAPEAFNKALDEFLKQLEGGSAR